VHVHVHVQMVAAMAALELEVEVEVEREVRLAWRAASSFGWLYIIFEFTYKEQTNVQLSYVLCHVLNVPC